ncbi:hypothetical protein NUSPORA_00956 [Nucleospora cyclopteri]
MLSQGQILRNSSRTALPDPPVTRENVGPGIWYVIARMMTAFIPDCAITRIWNRKTDDEIQAWREKVALCMIVAFNCVFLAGITYGINKFVCNNSEIIVFNKLKPTTFKNKNIIIADGAIWESDEDYGIVNNTHLFKKRSAACKKAFGSQAIDGDLTFSDFRRLTDIYWDWNDVDLNGFIVIDGNVYDPTYNLEQKLDDFINEFRGTEATETNLRKYNRHCIQCFKDTFYSGKISFKSNGCIFGDIILYCTAVMIFGLVFSKFFLALIYHWYSKKRKYQVRGNTPIIMLVTCYTEDKDGISATLDSLTVTDYSTDYKLIIAITDGQVRGEGNDKSTPDILRDLCELDDPEPKSYIALAAGHKRHNKAKVHTGWYHCNDKKCRIMVINKMGNEQETCKPGNRGKRDSQVILMSFFSKILYNDRMSDLEVEIYLKMDAMFNTIRPEDFEILMMVDADTNVNYDAIKKMVSVFETDSKVMGLCGETQILNKNESWVTNIQVFEYYISHHLAKNFESVFGGVTCLPGCFCCYRIKLVTDAYGNIKNHSDKKIYDEKWTCVPLLANPIIVNPYSAYDAKTLHEKNLLHLGEDRYLTTLLMKNFYKRKLIFVAAAKCSTYVPARFQVLKSQRRRWINSTIHNMFELAVVDKLCGTSCFSMQFIIVCELFGTLTLPAAILFTGILVASSILYEPAWIPLIMLGAILGLPALLIFLTTFKIEYIYWLFIYILALPIWNFVLPMYAFWQFDNFSWGDTRKVDGGTAEKAEDGEFDAESILYKDFVEVKSIANQKKGI